MREIEKERPDQECRRDQRAKYDITQSNGMEIALRRLARARTVNDGGVKYSARYSDSKQLL